MNTDGTMIGKAALYLGEASELLRRAHEISDDDLKDDITDWLSSFETWRESEEQDRARLDRSTVTS